MKEIVKVLGLCWNIKRDKLSLYSRPEPVSRTPVTKREILCHTSSVFDPLGLVTPVTITAKLLLQELWQDSVPWDTVLNDTYQSKWASITADILIASQQWFPRQFIPSMLSVNPSSAYLR